MYSERDLTSRALIRDRALALFATHGPDAVTIREIAAAAGVSPGLVVHHYGSKQSLRDAVNEHVTHLFDEMFASITADPAPLVGGGPRAAASFAELMTAYLPADSPVPAYLRRLLLSGDTAGRELFRRWFSLSAEMTEQLVAAGVLRPAVDIGVRTAFLIINDLAVLLLRDHLTDALGIDPLSPNGARRWASDVIAAYTDGVFLQEGS